MVAELIRLTSAQTAPILADCESEAESHCHPYRLLVEVQVEARHGNSLQPGGRVWLTSCDQACPVQSVGRADHSIADRSG